MRQSLSWGFFGTWLWLTAMPALASDELVQALARKGFVPWASDYVGEPSFQPGGDQIILGSGFLVRLPVQAQARQFLVATGTKSVIVDRINEVGRLGLSLEAAEWLGLPTQGSAAGQPIPLQIIALQRQATIETRLAPQTGSLVQAQPDPILELALTSPQAVYAPPGQEAVPPVSEDLPVRLTPSVASQAPEVSGETEVEDPFLSDLEPASPIETINSKPVSSDKLTFAMTSDNKALFDKLAAGQGLFLTFETGTALEPDGVANTKQHGTGLASESVVPPSPGIAVAAKPIEVAVQTTLSKGQGLFLQAGYFRDKGNADRLHARLESRGIPATIRPESVKGVPRWRVLAGPFSDIPARQAAKAHGGALLSDAYPIRLR